MLKTKWVCPNCTELSPTRHWSVQRHVQRKHAGVGEPISINTHQTRTQMGMTQGLSNADFVPGSKTQHASSANNFRYQNIPFGPTYSRLGFPGNKSITNFVGYNTNCTHLRTPAIRSPQEPEVLNKQGDNLASKFEEIRKLLHQYFEPYFADAVIMKLTSLVFNDKSREPLVDEILWKLRINTNSVNKLTEILPHFLYSNSSCFNAMVTNEVPLHEHSVGRLTPLAVRKIRIIERMLNPYASPARIWDITENLIGKFSMTRQHSILDDAIEKYRIQVQKYGTRGSY